MVAARHTMIGILHLLSVPALIALNAFFVGAEYAVVSLRSSDIAQLRAKRHTRTADAVSRLRADLPSAIGAIQVCITMTNLLLGWIGEPAMGAVIDQLLQPLGLVLPHQVSTGISTAVSFLIVTLMTVVLSELLPKALTLQHTLSVAVLTAVPLVGTMRLMRPLVWVMNTMASGVTQILGLGPVRIDDEAPTADEIRAIATEAADAGALTSRERAFVLNALSLGRRGAREVMVPRVKVSHIDLNQPMDRNAELIEQSLHSRLPLTEGGMDHIVGIITTKEFLTAYHAGADASVLRLIAREAVFVPVGVSLDRLLTAFRENNTQMLFLVDEHGGIEGLVTLQDVFDELIDEGTGSNQVR